jgi:hypothetical protein
VITILLFSFRYYKALIITSVATFHTVIVRRRRTAENFNTSAAGGRLYWSRERRRHCVACAAVLQFHKIHGVIFAVY